MVKKKRVYSIALLLFGTLAPMPIIRLFSITMYVWWIMILGMIVLMQWVSQGGIKFHKQYDRAFVAVVGIWLISYLICVVRMPMKWTSGIGTSFLQMSFLVIVYIFFSQSGKVQYLAYYVKGVYISSIIQMVWSYIQILFDAVGKDLNSIVFRDILHMIEEYATQYQFGRLKVSGLCWNAGNLAPLITFGYIYTKNSYLKVAFLFLGFLSGSRTMMLGLIVGTVIELAVAGKSETTISKKKIVLLIVLVTVIVSALVTNMDTFLKKVMEIADLLDIRNRVKTEGSASTHLYYLTSIPEITMKNNFISNLFGYGPGCSGYAQSELMNFYATSDKWSIECDYVNQLWSYGYIGFAIYYYWYLKNFIRTIHLDKKYVALFIAFLFEGLLYNITFNWMLFLIISIFLLAQSKVDIFKLDDGILNWRKNDYFKIKNNDQTNRF